jgi:hypothetical protein
MNAQLIDTLNESRKSELAPYYELQDDRWNRYIDCQDDTIVGGISYNVTSNSIMRINSKYDLLIEQFNNGGFLTSKSEMLCLFDLDGNFITDNIVSGTYGKCFCFSKNGITKFVGLAKKQSTYEKKGYKAIYRVREFKYVFNGKITDKGYKIFDNIELISEVFSDTQSIDLSNDWINYLYISNLNK